MISKPILKQSIQANWKLWLIITVVASTILSAFIITFDAQGFAGLASAAEGTRFSNVLSSMTSLLGSLENFYKLIAVILGIVYVVFTANNLVVNEVDSGSMAYTLSTPIKRSSVIFTKSLYLILSVVLMYIIISLAGMGASQFQFKNVSGYPVTDDVRAAALAINQDEEYIANRMYVILDDEQAMREAAYARDMDVEAYEIYLKQLLDKRSYEEAADIITDERWDLYRDDEDMEDEDIEMTPEELAEDPAMILASNDALIAGANVKGISVNEYQQFINDEIAGIEGEGEAETDNEEGDGEEGEGNQANQANAGNTQGDANLIASNQIENPEITMQAAVTAAAGALNMEPDQVQENMSLLKDPKAVAAIEEATGLQEPHIIQLSNHAMVSSAQQVDNALDFDLEAYLWLSVGIMLLMLAMSSISFLASTVFNRSGIALAIGGGIPFAFFLITMVRQVMDAGENLEKLTITSFFDTEAIINGGDFGLGLAILGGMALVFYVASNVIFTRKDLPL